MKIGFMGLGQMGKGMALNLAKCGCDYVVNDISDKMFHDFEARGIKATLQVSELRDADIVFLCLPGTKVVENVILGKGGLAEKMHAGQIIVDCSTIAYLPTVKIAQELANLITLLLGITISASMKAEAFVRVETLLIMGLGLLAFVFDSIAGVMFAKLLNLFCKKKVNPMVGAAGISAFPMSARVIQKLGLEADPQNHLLMHAVGANVSGQIASVVACGVILNLVPNLL